MTVWLFVGIGILVLVVLGITDDFMLGDYWLGQLSSSFVSGLGLGLVVLCTYALARCAGSKYRTVILVLCSVSLAMLFAVRALIAAEVFDQKTLDTRHIVQAKAYIPTISDAIYDSVQGTSYRQMAVLSDVKISQNTINSKQIQTIANPLSDTPSTIAPPTDTALDALNGIHVLMSASPQFGQRDLSVLNTLKPGDVADVVLLMTPIGRTVSASGFDANQWLRTRHIHANARIIQVGEVSGSTPDRLGERLIIILEQYRYRLRMHFYQDWHTLTTTQAQAKAVTLSLLTGDRALIDKATKELYQLAGISHLLAISGAHVLFLAMMLAALVLWVLDRFAMRIYQTIPRWQIRMAIMVMASLLYALFTGFDVPAVRTVYMLMAVWAVRYFALSISALSVLCVVALVMVWFDPYVLWQAGFWLSFIAVLLLMRYEMDDTAVVQGGMATNLGWMRAKQIIKLQCWLFFAMLPLSVMLFGKVSIWGLVVNLFAVSLFGAVIVPINLIAGAIFAMLPSVSDLLWSVSAQILAYLHTGLEFTLMGQIGGISAWLYAPFGMAGFVLCFIMIGLILLPKVLPKTALIVPMAALLLIGTPKPSSGIELIWLDSDDMKLSQYLLRVHGETGTKHWLVLSEQGTKLKDNHATVLIDTLHRQRVDTLDGVIVQSPSGQFMPVVANIHQTIPIHRYWQAGRHEPLPSLYHEPCIAGMAWQDDALGIRALTGWQMIDDERVQHCELEIVSDLPMLRVDMPSEADATKATVDELDEALDYDAKSEQVHHAQQGMQLVTKTSAEPILWRIWTMLCESEPSLALSPRDTHQPVILGALTPTDTAPIKEQLPTAIVYPTDK